MLNSTRKPVPLPNLPEPPFSDPVGDLAAESPRLANVVEATSRKRDVRSRRAKILLLLLALACPVNAAPARAWYVPGAVARVGAEGLLRAWQSFFHEPAPSLRSMRSHLGELERSLAIVASPGDWMPVARDPEHPERRPRYPQTFHLLVSDEAAEWWEREGLELAQRHPESRQNPDAWRRLFRSWRERAARVAREPMLPFVEQETMEGGKPAGPKVSGRVEDPARQRMAAADIARAASDHQEDPLALLSALRAAGVSISGSKVAASLAREPRRLVAAARMLARALERGDRVRNRAGWLVRMFRAVRVGGAA